MQHIFKIVDISGRKIHLSRERWKHINQEHPEVADCLHEIQETITKPSKVRQFKYDKKVQYYFRYHKKRKNYLLVIGKYLNGDGFIITSYFVRSIR